MNATTQAIGAVMGSGDIRVTTTGSSDELLVISSGETTLTLRPAVSGGAETALAGTEWRVAALYRGDEEVLPRPDHAADLQVRRASGDLGRRLQHSGGRLRHRR